MLKERKLLLELGFTPISYKLLSSAFTRVIILWELENSRVLTKSWKSNFKLLSSDLGFTMANMFQGNLQVIHTPIRKRVENEVVSQKLLDNCSIRTPKIIFPKQDEHSRVVVEQFLDNSENVFDYLINRPGCECEDVIYQVGTEIGKIHNHGFALGDSRCTNILVKEDKDYFVDRELFIREAKLRDMVSDVIVFLSSLPIRTRLVRYARIFIESYEAATGYRLLFEDVVRKSFLAFPLLQVINRVD
jgi:tRNA A-37 threonylcarbamoyl transferase component Bud32